MTIGIDARLWGQTGIGRYIRNLVANLSEVDKKNQYVLFVRPEDKGEILDTLSTSQFTIIPTNIKWHSVREQIEFPRLLNKYNLDLMHFPYFSVPVFYKKPFVVTVHDLIINHFPTGRATTLPKPIYKLKTLGYEFVLKRAIHDAKKILVPSLATKDEISDHYKRDVKKDNIVVTPEGVDENISDFAPNLFKEKEPHFLYVGNVYPHKNVERLIEAFTLFSETHPQYVLKLVGKKDFFYKRLEKKTKAKNIEFVDFVTDEELSKLYSQAEVTFAPSLMEGFGLTALEAMKMGSVVAASNIPSLKEVCGNDAFYFDPEDTLSIVKVMNEVVTITEEKRSSLIKSAQKRAQTFSWEKTAKLTLEAYNSCLNH